MQSFSEAEGRLDASPVSSKLGSPAASPNTSPASSRLRHCSGSPLCSPGSTVLLFPRGPFPGLGIVTSPSVK